MPGIVFVGAFVLSIALFSLALLNPNAGIDVQQHDVYFVIGLASVYNTLGLFLLIKAMLVFFLLKEHGSNRLLSGNLLLEVGLIFFGVGIKYYHFHYSFPSRYNRFDGYQAFSDGSTSFFTQIVISAGVLYLLNQLFFIIILILNRIKTGKGQQEDNS